MGALRIAGHQRERVKIGVADLLRQHARQGMRVVLDLQDQSLLLQILDKVGLELEVAPLELLETQDLQVSRP